MKKNFRIIIAAVVAIMVVLAGVFMVRTAMGKKKAEQISVVTTGFAPYDFSRAVVGDASEVTMLLKPGSEAHDYEPTPQDIIKISKADLFVYVGGESDEWVEEVLKDNNIPEEKTLKLMNLVEVKEEELVEGMEEGYEHEEYGEEEVEYDEHVWTSPVNAVKIVEGVSKKLSEIKGKNKEKYAKNAEKYVAELKELDKNFREVVSSAKRKEVIFGDRFPFRYFVDEYGLSYFAAFPGCAEQTEASSATVAFLIRKVKEDKIPVILKIELTSGKLAKTISDETGAKVLEFSAAHNISQEEFDKGTTYIDIMKKNVDVLKEALN